MARPKYDPTAQKGVLGIGAIFESWGWAFRPQPASDVGIDAHVEIVEGGEATGRLVGLQIKAGGSYVRRNADGDVVYYGKEKHREYWTRHTLPVVLLIHDPENNQTIWAVVSERAVEETKGGGWKITLPMGQVLQKTKPEAFLEALTPKPTAAERRRERLALGEPLMRAILAGSSVALETEDWVNKSLKRGDFKFLIDEDESTAITWGFTYAAYPLEEALHSFFPWAKFAVNRHFYDQHRDEKRHWQDSCHD
jgi:hypothetical protein